MTKQQYLERLEGALYLKLSPSAARDVLEDYEGFFEQKRADGLSDRQICEDLGDPSAVAAEMARELGGGVPRRKSAGAAAAFALYVLFCHFTRYSLNAQAFGMATAALLTALAFLLRGEPDTRAVQDDRSRLVHLLLLALMTGMVTSASAAVLHTSRAGSVFPFWNTVLNVQSIAFPLAAFVIALHEMARAGRQGIDCRPAVFHAVAVVIGIKLVCETLSRLDRLDTFWLSLLTPCAVYASMAVVSAAAPAFARRMRGLE